MSKHTINTHAHKNKSQPKDRGENKSYRFTGNEKDAHTTTSLHMYPLKRLCVLLLCSMATSTSIKKEINGPGASEWTHSHRTQPCHMAAMSAGEAQRPLKPSVQRLSESLLNTENISPLNKGISSHMIDSEQNMMLVPHHDVTVFSLETSKAMVQTKQMQVRNDEALRYRGVFTEVTLPHLQLASAFFLIIKFAVFALFLTLISFVFFSIYFRKQTNKQRMVRMDGNPLHVLSTFSLFFFSLPAKPHSILTITNLTAQNMSQCKLGGWGGNGSAEDVTIRPE